MKFFIMAALAGLSIFISYLLTDDQAIFFLLSLSIFMFIVFLFYEWLDSMNDRDRFH